MEDNLKTAESNMDHRSEQDPASAMSEWTYPEWVALVYYYTGFPLSNFFMAPETTQRVVCMKERYPKSGFARPMSMGVMMAKIMAKGKQLKAEPMDVTPVVQGKNFVTVTVPEENASIVYTAPRAVEVVADLLEQVEGDLEIVRETKPQIVCCHGVVPIGPDQESARKQRVAAVCQSLLKPDEGEKGCEPAITVTPSKFEREVLTQASTKLNKSCSVSTSKVTQRQLYDQMLGDPASYAYVSHLVGAELQDTVYQSSTSESQELRDVASPVRYRKYQDPIAVIKQLEPAVGETKMNGITANMVDGLAVSGPLRTRMNDLADVQIPLGAKIVYLDQLSRDMADQIAKRETHVRRIVFYRTETSQDNEILMRERLKVTTEHGVARTEIIQGGVIPYYGHFESPDPTVTVYVNLNRTETAETTQAVYDMERRKYDGRPNARWYLIGVHVYALDPGLSSLCIQKGMAFIPNYYVSRDFQACKVLNTNYLIPGLTRFGRYKIMDVFIHIMRCAIAYPITRAVCTGMVMDNKEVKLLPLFAYYPLSGEDDMKRFAQVNE